MSVTWNSSDQSTWINLTNSDMTASGYTEGSESPDGGAVRCTKSLSSGKWYWEIECSIPDADDCISEIGISKSTFDLSDHGIPGEDAVGWIYQYDGDKGNNNSYTTFGNSYTGTVVIGVAYDATNGKLYFSKDGTWQNSGDPAAGTGYAYSSLSGTMYPTIFGGSESGTGTPSTFTLVTESDDLTYTKPTGFSQLEVATTNDIEGDLPATTGVMHQSPYGNFSGSIPAITGSLRGASQINVTLKSITGSISTSANINKNLPAITGVISESVVATLLINLPKLTGSILAKSRVNGALPGITGSMVAGYGVAGEIPFITGSMKGASQVQGILPLVSGSITTGSRMKGTLGMITGGLITSANMYSALPVLTGKIIGSSQLENIIPGITGDLSGSQNISAHFSFTLPSISGELNGYQEGFSTFNTEFIPALRGELQASVEGFAVVDRSLPAIRGTVTGVVGGIGYIDKKLPGLLGTLSGVQEVTGVMNGELGFEGSIYASTGIGAELSGRLSFTGQLYGRQESTGDNGSGIDSDDILSYTRRLCG